MNRHETKFQNTAARMNQALIALMEKKHFESISITALCEQAGINRSTFYSHYQNMNELLDDTRCYILKLFTDQFLHQETAHSSLTSGVTVPEDVFFRDEFLVPYLKVFSENRHIFLIPDFHPGQYQFSREYLYMFEEIAVPFCRAAGITDLTSVEYITQYYAAGVHAIIIQWLQRDCRESIAEICQLIRRCMRGSTALQSIRDNDTMKAKL